MNRTIAQLFNPTWLAKSLLALVAFTFPLFPVTAQAPGKASLPGHVIGALQNATRLPHDPAKEQETIRATINLRLTDETGEKALLDEYVTPTAPSYHKTMSPAEYLDRFGPSQEAWDKVLAYLQENGLTLTRSSSDRRSMRVTGTRAQMQKAFGVVIDDYQLGERSFHAIASDPVVPAEIAPLIFSVTGLSNLARPHHLSNYTPNPITPQLVATGYDATVGTGLGPVLPPGLNGAGQTVGLVEFDGIETTDVSNWLQSQKLPPELINNVLITNLNGGGIAPSGCTYQQQQCGTVEALLDVDIALSTARGAFIDVIEEQGGLGDDYVDSITSAISYLEFSKITSGAVLSITTVTCEGDNSQSDAQTIDAFAQTAMLHGVAVFSGSGDNGSTCVAGSDSYPGGVDMPTDGLHIVAVGGTVLELKSGTNTYGAEKWWTGGGYGISQFFTPEPSYQDKWYPGQTGRSVPDVAITYGPVDICQAIPSDPLNCNISVAGTSLSTPLFAAIWAIANQATSDAGQTPWSPANGYFYSHTGGFHLPGSSGEPASYAFPQVGLGSPNVADMISIAVPPRIDSFSPLTGPGTGGTTLTIIGAGFIGVTKVTIGGTPATSVTVDSDTKLTVVTPGTTAPTAFVEVITPGGTATSSEKFTYIPEILFVTPTSGPFEGGTAITVYGVALANDDSFQFGGSLFTASGVSCGTGVDGPYCTMTTPAHVPGTVDIVAVSPSGGTSTPNANSRFQYLRASLTSISPLVGPTVLPGVQVTIQGTSLAAGITTVNFGSVPVPVSSCSSDRTFCFLTSPAHAAGSVPLSVTVHGTTLTYRLPFTFEVFPTITGISPSRANAGATVTLTGTGFSTVAGQTTFSFFGISVPGTCSSTQCTAVVPTETLGTAQTTAVTVTVNGNTSLDSVTFSYATLVKPPPCKGTICG